MTKTCPQCLGEYTLGVDGTVDGCDVCEGVTRNADGMIINDGILIPNLLADLIITEEE